jgi:predicted GIY-YIG superfamily endonuclease
VPETQKSARTIAHEARIVTRAVIYLLTEVATGRHYVGQARDFETRMRGHLIGRVAPFDHYLRQVGRGAFRETIRRPSQERPKSVGQAIATRRANV